GESPGAAHEVPALALESLDRDPVVPVVGGYCLAALRNGCPVGFDHRVAGEAGNATAFGEHVVGPDHHLGGDTPVVRAFAADQVALDANHFQTLLREGAGKLLAADPHAKDDDVGALSHARTPPAPPSGPSHRRPPRQGSGSVPLPTPSRPS